MDKDRRKLLSLHLNTLYCATILLHKLKPKMKKWWVHPIWQERRQLGAYTALVKSLKQVDPVYFKKYLRLTPYEFNILKTKVHPFLKKNPAGRKNLSTGHRLAITLRFLASGDSMTSISFAFRVGFSTACEIIHEVCDALWQALKTDYIPAPTHEKWKEIATGFWNHWQFPNCLGAVDGKHVTIQAPPKSGSRFYNYKGHFLTVLLAIVDSNYKFIVADIGGYGSNSDGGLWKSSKFGRKFDSEKIAIPASSSFPNTNVKAPYVLIGDEAFQLRPDFLRPYPGKQLDETRRIFNYRLSRARRCVENAFGIMAARWRIFRRPINLLPQNVDKVVKACIVLHNFLKTESESKPGSLYCPRGFADQFDANGVISEGEWREEIDIENTAFSSIAGSAVRNFSKNAADIRDRFAEYFVSSGSLEWQAEAAGINEVYDD